MEVPMLLVFLTCWELTDTDAQTDYSNPPPPPM